MITDGIMSVCPKCGQDGCYRTMINEVKASYFCFGCGYYTTDFMIQGEFNFEAFEETLPELYKDVKYVDSEKRVWYPASINLPELGTVFLNGQTADNVFWSAIKVTPLTEEELLMPKYKGMKFKSDAKTLKSFGDDFIEACDYIGMFSIPLNLS